MPYGHGGPSIGGPVPRHSVRSPRLRPGVPATAAQDGPGLSRRPLIPFGAPEAHSGRPALSWRRPWPIPRATWLAEIT